MNGTLFLALGPGEPPTPVGGAVPVTYTPKQASEVWSIDLDAAVDIPAVGDADRVWLSNERGEPLAWSEIGHGQLVRAGDNVHVPAGPFIELRPA